MQRKYPRGFCARTGIWSSFVSFRIARCPARPPPRWNPRTRPRVLRVSSERVPNPDTSVRQAQATMPLISLPASPARPLDRRPRLGCIPPQYSRTRVQALRDHLVPRVGDPQRSQSKGFPVSNADGPPRRALPRTIPTLAWTLPGSQRGLVQSPGRIPRVRATWPRVVRALFQSVRRACRWS